MEEGEKPFIMLHPPPVATDSTLLLRYLGRKPNPQRRERGPPPPPPKLLNLIRNMNGTTSPKGSWHFFTLTGTWLRVD